MRLVICRTRRTVVALLALALAVAACGQTSTAPVPPDDAPVAIESEPVDQNEHRDDGQRDDDRVSAPPHDATPVDEPEPSSQGDDAEEAAERAEEGSQGDAASAAAEEPDAAPATEPAAPPARQVTDTGWAPFAGVEGIVLHHPSARVEMVGFHQANHDGARQLGVAESATAPMTLESRQRTTGSRSAADVVVDPGMEIRAPVTGTILRAGTYVLYCDYSDDYVVIEPDARPGWEVKLLHIDGVRVEQGQRVRAGETVLAPRPTPLPFESQVDEHTAEPSWPHVHVEVVDPSIPNENTGGGC